MWWAAGAGGAALQPQHHGHRHGIRHGLRHGQRHGQRLGRRRSIRYFRPATVARLELCWTPPQGVLQLFLRFWIRYPCVRQTPLHPRSPHALPRFAFHVLPSLNPNRNCTVQPHPTTPHNPLCSRPPKQNNFSSPPPRPEDTSSVSPLSREFLVVTSNTRFSVTR